MNSNNQVKQLRLQRAWSQEQLAEMAGLSVRTIQRIENGERPGLETLSALAAVFEVTVAEIGGEARREDAPGQEASLDLRIEEAKARVHQESRFFRSLSVALVVCVLLAVLNRFTNPQYYWSGWVALIWGALLVEQFYDFAAGLADHYLVMSRGAIVQQGKGDDMESDGVRAMVTI